MDIYTDGACHDSTKIGGIGVVFVKNNKIIYKFNKQFTDTTNNRMEMIAVIEAKKTSVDPRVGRNQAKLYADCIE